MSPRPASLVLVVKVRPGAKRNAWRGVVGGALKVDIAAPPERGRANEQLLQFVAESFAVPRRAVVLLSGGSGRQKQLRIHGRWEIPADLQPYLAEAEGNHVSGLPDSAPFSGQASIRRGRGVFGEG